MSYNFKLLHISQRWLELGKSLAVSMKALIGCKIMTKKELKAVLSELSAVLPVLSAVLPVLSNCQPSYSNILDHDMDIQPRVCVYMVRNPDDRFLICHGSNILI